MLTCGPWTRTNPPIMPIDGQNHNYCRNPNGHRRSPYCLTTKGIFGYCVIPECVSQLIEISDKLELYFKINTTTDIPETKRVGILEPNVKQESSISQDTERSNLKTTKEFKAIIDSTTTTKTATSPIQSTNSTCQDEVFEIQKVNEEKLTLARKQEAKCNLVTYHKHWAEVEKLMQLEMAKLMKEFRKQIQLDRKLCYKIEEKYLPFGLDSMVPESLHCQFNVKSEFIHRIAENYF